MIRYNEDKAEVKPVKWDAKQFKTGDVILGKDDRSGNYMVWLKRDKRFAEFTPSEMLEVFDYFK